MTDSVDGELKHVSAEHSTGNPFCSDAVYQGVPEGHKCRRQTHRKDYGSLLIPSSFSASV